MAKIICISNALKCMLLLKKFLNVFAAQSLQFVVSGSLEKINEKLYVSQSFCFSSIYVKMRISMQGKCRYSMSDMPKE
jgi:hypothetical protein